MRTFAAANGHDALGGVHEPEAVALSRVDFKPSLPLRTEFSDPERRSLELLGEDLRETIAAAVSNALSLISENRDAARLDVIAKAIACERARQLELSRRLDELLLSRDLEAVVVVDRLLTNSNRRVCALLAEHRASCTRGSRAAVLVAHAETVRVHARK
jgi:hypothetical protein